MEETLGKQIGNGGPKENRLCQYNTNSFVQPTPQPVFCPKAGITGYLVSYNQRTV